MTPSDLSNPAVRIRAHGGPEVLELHDAPVGEPGAGQLRIRHAAIGLNFIDVYQRTGLYPNAMPLATTENRSSAISCVDSRVAM